MNYILSFLFSAVTGAVGWFIARTGLKVAIGSAAIAAWILLIISFTAAMETCFGSTCGGAVNWSHLSQWVKFGLSLVPSNVPTAIACIVSARAAAWSAIVAGTLLRTKASVGGAMIPRG